MSRAFQPELAILLGFLCGGLLLLALLAILLWWLLRRPPAKAAAPQPPPAPPEPETRAAPVEVAPAAEPEPPPAPPEPPPAPPEPPPAPPEPPEPDDLQVIEGIGPKISSVFQAAGITTFAALAAREPGELKAILEEAGIRLGDPTTWPEQAALAAQGLWDELEALTGSLRGGRRV